MPITNRRTGQIGLISLGILLLLLTFLLLLYMGPVKISPGEIADIIIGNQNDEIGALSKTIIMETRFPMAIAAICSGALLSVAGLMMQTLFQNPLAGPSILGISSGSSFGVAVLMLSASGITGVLSGALQPLFSILAALAGGLSIIFILLFFSALLRSGLSLLIVGLMLSYLFSSGISLLNYFSPAEEIRSYLVWGLGSFTGLRFSSSIWFLGFAGVSLFISIFFIKPLNALLLGERYLESVGFSIKKVRSYILIVTGLLVAVPTAFCGPISFIGLIVPHLCRLLFRSSNHSVLLPASMIYGGLTTAICALICIMPSAGGSILPINIITPVIGVPVILYLLVNRNKLPYLS